MMRFNWRSRPLIAALLIPGLIAASAVGCGKGGVGRLRVQGSVTHSGKPVPAGQVRFEPNASKGGSGPVGFAKIVDGEFDTSLYGGKGPVAGPMRVKVTGYVSAKPFAPELFPRHTEEVDIAKGNRDLVIDVPGRTGDG